MTTAIARTLDNIDLFRPLDPRTLADLCDEYDRDRAGMEAIAEALASPLVAHFVDANLRDYHFSADRLGELAPALAALDASYWQRALDLTDVLDSMPQKRRDEWHEQIRGHATPPFERASVVSTMRALLDARVTYFAERVDGLFRALSPEHLTNCPTGFRSRMIVNYVYNGSYACHDRCGYIHDLRAVLAKLSGAEAPRHYMTTRLVEYAVRERRGEWIEVDGGRLRIRVYKKGTAHIEVHSEIAWVLNAILAHLHPHAIPAEHRRRLARKGRVWDLWSNPIPGPVISALADGRIDGREFRWSYAHDRGAAHERAEEVLVALGGREVRGRFEFDYAVRPVLAEVMATGMIPDAKAHQFYPTPPDLAAEVAALAAIEPSHRVLEPSAGHGAIAAHLPAGATLVEVSALHCAILEARDSGQRVVCADFLGWRDGLFDRIVMNPPYSAGRAVLHLEHAASMVAPGGSIVAVLPASMAKARLSLPGLALRWGDPRPFPGTSIEVAVLVADRCG